jgi:hypothetical protein
MDAPCDSGRRVAGGVGWGKRFGVSGMGSGVGGSEYQAGPCAAFALVPRGGPWNDPEVGSFPAPWGRRKTMRIGCISRSPTWV